MMYNKIMIVCVSIVYQMSFCINGTIGDSWTKVLHKQNFIIKESYGFIYQTNNKWSCLVQCSRNSTCIGGYFNGATTTCYHFDVFTVLAVTDGTSSDESVLVPQENGIAVIYLTSLTSTAADDFCRDFGGNLMTLPEMTDFYNRGLQKCRCGWIADGTQRKFSQTEQPTCSIGINSCATTNTRETFCTIRL